MSYLDPSTESYYFLLLPLPSLASAQYYSWSNPPLFKTVTFHFTQHKSWSPDSCLHTLHDSDPHTHTHAAFLISFSTLLPIFSSPCTVSSLLFPERAKCTPTSGPLYLLFLLPRVHFPRLFHCLGIFPVKFPAVISLFNILYETLCTNRSYD